MRRFLLFLTLVACSSAKKPPANDALFVQNDGPCYTPPHGMGEAVEDPPYNNTQHLPPCPDPAWRNKSLGWDAGYVQLHYLNRDSGYVNLFRRDAGGD